MALFFTIITLALTSIWYYVGARLFWPISNHQIYHLAVILFLVFTWLLQLWRFTTLRNPKASPALVNAAFFSLGLFTQLLVLTAFKDLTLIWFDLDPIHNLGFFSLGIFLNVLSMRNAFAGPIVKFISIENVFSSFLDQSQKDETNKPLDSDPQVSSYFRTQSDSDDLNKKSLRIVQISDLHVGPIIQTSYVELVVQKILELKPDIVVATGDIGDGDASSLSIHLESFKKIKAPKYYVTGNHEYYWNAPSWIAGLERVGFKHLLNEGTALLINSFSRRIWLAGVPDLQGVRFIPSHKIDIQKSLEGSRSEDYKILLAHQPKVCHMAQKSGFDLLLNGHTHGGQFFPFTLVVGLFNPYSEGMNDHHGLKVYVNLGTGFWGPPLRLGAPSEISVFDLS